MEYVTDSISEDARGPSIQAGVHSILGQLDRGSIHPDSPIILQHQKLQSLRLTFTLNVNGENVLKYNMILSTDNIHSEFLMCLALYVWNYGLMYEISLRSFPFHRIPLSTFESTSIILIHIFRLCVCVSVISETSGMGGRSATLLAPR